MRIRSLLRILLLSATLSSLSLAARSETITLGGVGSLTPLLKQLAAEYSRKHPGVEIHVMEPPIGSAAGIRALAMKKVDIALSGRPTKGDEAGVTKPWLQTPLVLATRGGKSKGLSRNEVAEIYAARRTTWDDGSPIRLVLRGEQESETKMLRSMSPEVDVAVGEALKRQGLPVAENDIDALDMLGTIQGSFGTTSLGLLKSKEARLAVLPIDGVQPSATALENGRYRFARTYYLILPTAPAPTAHAFAQWLTSPAALAMARTLDFIPLK